MTTCTDGSVRFGKPGCTNPEICIPPFKPICAFDVPRATEPMTLEAPHPLIVLPLPPSECACFSFEEKNGTVSIKKKADKTVPKFTVEIKQASPDCCEGKYQVTPSIEIPECIMDDDVKTGTCELGGLGGTLVWTLKRTNCELSLEMSGDIPVPSIPLPCLPTFNLNTTNVKIKYKENASDTQEKETTGAFKVREDREHGCPLYVPEEMNLGVLGSMGFANGGGVSKISGGGGGGGDDKLQIDGGTKDGKDTWYGGGYGDRPNNDYYNNTFCRGPVMRGNQPSPVSLGEDGYPVPKATTPTAFDMVVGNKHTAQTMWTSGRMTVGNNGKYAWASSANLNIVWPTGAQWHTRGLALTLTEFEYNDSGVLSYAEEKGESILVSPAPAYTVAADGKQEQPASGLVVLADPSETSRIQHGLRVNAGDGLRIYGIGDGSTASDDEDESRQGALEIMYGPGFRIRDTVVEGEKTYLDKPVDRPGALVPNDGRGLRVHGFTKMKKQYPNTSQTEDTIAAQKNKLEIHAFDNDLAFQADRRLVFNDKAGTSHHKITKLTTTSSTEHPNTDLRASYRGGDWHEITGTATGKDAEYTIPLLVSYYNKAVSTHTQELYSVSASGKVMVNGDNIYNTFAMHRTFGEDATDILEAVVIQLQRLFNTLGIAFQHVGKAGIILGTDQAETLPTTATRYADH